MLRLVALLLLVYYLSQFGTDYNSYSIIYDGISTFSDYLYLEPGFRVLVVFAHWFGLSLDLFYVFVAFLTFIPVLYTLKKSNISLSFMYYLSIFLFPYVINGIRQSLAMGLGLLAVFSINNKNFFKSLLLLVIAASVHYGAVFYFLYVLLKLPNRFLGYFFFLVSILVAMYWGVSHIDHGFNSVNGFDVLYRFILVLLLSLFVGKENRDLYLLYLSGFLIYLAFYKDAQLAARIHFYFRIIEVLILAYPLRNKQLTKQLLPFMVTLFLVWNYYIYV